jgi:hypothetical protein
VLLADTQHLAWYLTLIVDYYACLHVPEGVSVLDSGSARHLQHGTRVLNGDDRIPLTGFDGSCKWTEGTGYIPIAVTDELTGTILPLDVGDADLMTES